MTTQDATAIPASDGNECLTPRRHNQAVIMHLNRVVGDSRTRPAALPVHLLTSCTFRQTGRNGTYTARRFHCRNTLHPASCTIKWSAYSPPHSPSTNVWHQQPTIIPLTHTTRGRAGAYKEGRRPLSCSLFIERSERFPHCLLEIPLATPWPKQTLRLANQNLLPPQLSSDFPVHFGLSIIPVCVLSLAQPSNPASNTNPHSHRCLPSCGPGNTIIDRRDLSPKNEDHAYPITHQQHVVLG